MSRSSSIRSRFDDRGWVKVADRAGHVRTLTEEHSALEGLAWSADGQSLFFSGMLGQATDFRPFVVSASGPGAVRPTFSSAGDVVMLDTTKSSRMLMTREEAYRGLRGIAPNDSTERDFGWLNFAVAGNFSTDGRLLTFTDVGPTSGNDYDVILRHTDGSGVVRLGPGAAQAISSDGKYVLSILPSSQQLLLYPRVPVPHQARSRASGQLHVRRAMVAGRQDRACVRLDVGRRIALLHAGDQRRGAGASHGRRQRPGAARARRSHVVHTFAVGGYLIAALGSPERVRPKACSIAMSRSRGAGTHDPSSCRRGTRCRHESSASISRRAPGRWRASGPTDARALEHHSGSMD